ncbi:MAG: PTS transporter subunit EIIC [Propioniciclava sp.]|uniref:PTS transporter subunit EIIC n=1 Tax=Propioniciclava sp. TaxID=2038686 RepID=UPI0039E51452
MDYKALSRAILDLVGGNDNVASFTNCMTRLRLNLIDTEKVDLDAIKELDGVLGVVPGDQLQIVVGPGHADRMRAAFAEVSDAAQLSFDGPQPEDDLVRDVADETRAKVKARQSTSVHAGFRHIGNIFIPIIPGFIAGGLIASIANFWKIADPSIVKNPWFLAFAALGGIVTGALHLIVGHNTAKEFGGTPVLGFIAGGVPYMPALAGIAAVKAADGSITTAAAPLVVPLFGQLSPALGGVIGAMITAWLFTVIEKWLRRFIPATLELFIIPVVTVLLGAVAAVLVIMPISALLMRGLTWLLVDFGLEQGGIVGGFLMSSLFLPMVMLGVHQGLTPLHAQLIADHGYTQLLPILAMAGGGQDGMAIAVYLKTRSKKLRTIIKSALPLGFLGIGEPLIYGVSLPLLYPFITACLGAGFGGAFMAWGMQAGGPFGAQALGLSGLFMTGVISPGGVAWYLGSLGIAVLMGFVLTYFFGFKESMVERLG